MVAISVEAGVSVINRVLKDLDRQGANPQAPIGVVAVNQADAPQPWPRRIALTASLAALLTAVGWFGRPVPESQPPAPLPSAPATPQLRLTQELASAPATAETQSNGRIPATTPATTPIRLPPARIAFVPQPPRLDTRLPELRRAPAAMVEAKPAVIKDLKPVTPQVQAEETWRQADRLLEQGRNHDARVRLETALRLDPEHDAARQSLIALTLEAGNVESAASLLREGIVLHPDDAWYPRSLAQLHLQHGDFSAAADILKSALKALSSRTRETRKHSDASDWALYASTLARLGQAEDCAAAYREALRRDPAQGAWWVGLGVALEHAGQSGKAAEAFANVGKTNASAELKDYAAQRLRELK